MIGEVFSSGDKFFVPFPDYEVEEYVLEEGGYHDNVSMRLTAAAIFMVKYEKEIKQGVEFSDEELEIIAREMKKLDNNKYIYRGPAIDIYTFEGDDLLPTIIATKDRDVAQRMSNMLTRIIDIGIRLGYEIF